MPGPPQCPLLSLSWQVAGWPSPLYAHLSASVRARLQAKPGSRLCALRSLRVVTELGLRDVP